MTHSTQISQTSREFLDAVLKLRPRVAVFDCDGTLWENNSGEDFLEWSLQAGMVSEAVATGVRQRYTDYKEGRVGEEVMCGEMTTMYAGLKVTGLEAAARKFYAEVVRPNIFSEMLQLTRKLAENGCDLWAVSSTNEWVVREGMREFGIISSHVLAAAAEIEDGVVTERLKRMPSGEGKALALREAVLSRNENRRIDVVFGNSVHDTAMLGMAKYAFAVNPNPDLEAQAKERGWKIYWPERITAVRM
ncbi:MAG TPA: HAD-IB family phosphatase [Terriglobales bacterium]|nr:HAD-IB family phosphatase [Terriglobales bacterium]